ncbi:cytochrome b/b6 domain-containing protein [bacterium]|nr:cytochrome b/b6 domain-containing protein [bacterium]
MSSKAVSSYEQSFHGRMLLRFGKKRAAGCVDCHSKHSIFVPNNSSSSVGREHAVRTCAGCHRGAGQLFAASGTSHPRLKIDRTPLLRLEEEFFKLLTYATVVLLMLVIGLDLRRKVFCAQHSPNSGRVVGMLVALGFSSLTAGLVMAILRVAGAEWAWLSAAGSFAAAFAVYATGRERRIHKPDGSKLYHRFTFAQRAQHVCLALSFTVLVLTGMPLHYADIGWSHYLHLLFGGLDGARTAHRIAAVLMTITWIWHFLFLLYRWRIYGFSSSTWTMLPTRKDLWDFSRTIAYGLGLRSTPPEYDRFQFRQKFDYLAVYWGMPIMVFSGAVLWFEVFFGNRLPSIALDAAYIAHSDEAILAMLAIMIWHLYNTHLDPDHFPMSRAWLSGVLTESEMAREHPAEKARIDAKRD